MQPNDANGHLPPDQRPFRVLVIAGSDGRQYNGPGVDSKARTLMNRMAAHLERLYARLDLADAWAIIAPSNGAARARTSTVWSA